MNPRLVRRRLTDRGVAPLCAGRSGVLQRLAIFAVLGLLSAPALATQPVVSLLAADLETLPRASEVMRQPLAGAQNEQAQYAQIGSLLAVISVRWGTKGLTLVDLDKGTQRWHQNVDNDLLAALALTPNGVFVGGNGRVQQRDLQTGKIIWQSPPQREVFLWQNRLVSCQTGRNAVPCQLQTLDQKLLWQGSVAIGDGTVGQWFDSADQLVPLVSLAIATEGQQTVLLTPQGTVEKVPTAQVAAVAPRWRAIGDRMTYRAPGHRVDIEVASAIMDYAATPDTLWAFAADGLHTLAIASLAPSTGHHPAPDSAQASDPPTLTDPDRMETAISRTPLVAPDHTGYLLQQLAGAWIVWQIDAQGRGHPYNLGEVQGPLNARQRDRSLGAHGGDRIVAVHNGLVVLASNDALIGYKLQGGETPRRGHVDLQTDVALWLDLAADRLPRTSTGECIDVPFGKLESVARLLRLDPQLWSGPLQARMRGATLKELPMWAPLACAAKTPDAVAQTWWARWREILHDLPAGDVDEHIKATPLCPLAVPDLSWRSALFDRMARQPWTQAWVDARLALLGALHDAPTEAEALAWAAALTQGVLGAIDRARAGTRSVDWVGLWRSSALWLHGWPGWPAFVQRFDLQLAAKGPAAVCLRANNREFGLGPCLREPPEDAWQAPSGWAVVSDGTGLGIAGSEVWAFRWDGGAWQGPYFLSRGPSLQIEHELKGWRTGDKWFLHDDGHSLSWRFEGDTTKCDPDELRMRNAARPPAIAWADIAVDKDGDGWTDLLEKALGTDPNRADSDGDGTPDSRDPAPLCAKTLPTAHSQGQAVLAAAMRLHTDVLPVRLAPDAQCADTPTVGGPILPATTPLQLNQVVVQPPMVRGFDSLWQVQWRSGVRGRSPEVHLQPVWTPDGWMAVVQ